MTKKSYNERARNWRAANRTKNRKYMTEYMKRYYSDKENYNKHRLVCKNWYQKMKSDKKRYAKFLAEREVYDRARSAVKE